jgi:hypothetical protein
MKSGRIAHRPDPFKPGVCQEIWNPDAFSPRLGSRRVDRELRRLRDAVGAHPGLTPDPGAWFASRGASRSDVFTYRPRFSTVGDVAPRVLVESGVGSADHPAQVMRLQSYLARFLRETQTSLQASDEEPFEMRLMHFRRTFVEKLFAVHKGLQRWRRGELPDCRPFVRHYYDLHALAGTPEVLAMLASDESGAPPYRLRRIRSSPASFREAASGRSSTENSSRG